MGRACVSFDCPSGPRDLVANDRSGLLVPAEDIDGLSAALQRLAADPDLRLRLGQQACVAAELFAPARIYGKWLRLLDAMVAGNTEAMLSSQPDQAASSAG